MVQAKAKPEALGADVQVPNGCPTCGGLVTIRVHHERGAGAYCAHCHRAWHPMVRMTPKGLLVMHPASGGSS